MLKENIDEILDSCIAAYDHGAVLLLNLNCFGFTISGSFIQTMVYGHDLKHSEIV
jgi:hypothetical protein